MESLKMDLNKSWWERVILNVSQKLQNSKTIIKITFSILITIKCKVTLKAFLFNAL